MFFNGRNRHQSRSCTDKCKIATEISGKTFGVPNFPMRKKSEIIDAGWKPKAETSAWPSFLIVLFLSMASWGEEEIPWVQIYLWTSHLYYLVCRSTLAFVGNGYRQK